jgi:hypothetical protein
MFRNAPPINNDLSFVCVVIITGDFYSFSSIMIRCRLSHVAVISYFLTTLQYLVVNFIMLNIIIAVLNTRYGRLTEKFSRVQYEMWLTGCLSDHVFKQNMIRGGRCRAFLLHVLDFNQDQLSYIEIQQLRFMIYVESFISRNR